MAKVAIQGGVKNYLPSKEVTVPVEAKSSKNHPATELAYITKAEKDLLIKQNIHNSLNGKPNKGPGGIISLNGDFGIGESYGDRQTSDKSAEDVSASRNRTAADKKQREDLLAGKLGYQNDPNNQNRSKSELGKAYTKGAYDSFGFGTKMGMYDKQYKAGLINRQIEKKKNAIRNLINKQRGQTYSPHMDTEEVLEGIMGSYDFNTNTFGKHTFDKGLNKGFDFDINQLNKNMPMTGAFGLNPNSRFTKDGKSVPLGINYLDTTPDLTSHPSTTPSIMGQILGKVSPMNQNTLKSTLNRINQLDDIALGGVTQSEINDYYDRAQGKGKYDIFGGGGDGDGPQPYLPINYNTGAATTEAVEPYTNDFTYRFGNTQGVGDDVTQGFYAATGGRAKKAEGGIMELRARRAFGGIMDRVTGRKAYGLGSIFKKVTRAAKKVLSSDIGKAAIIGAGIYYGGGGKFKSGGAKNFSFFGNNYGKGFFSKDNPLLFSGAAEDRKFSPWKLAAMTVGTGAAMGPAKVDQLPGDGRRGGHLIDPITGKEALPSQMRASLNNALDNADGDPVRIQQINDAYAFLGPDERLGTYLPYRTYGVKDGGRIGFNSGGGFSKNDLYLLKKFKYDPKEVATHKDGGKDLINSLKTVGFNMGGRINKAEGGLMDLGGMEKDYRAEGGFVPIGAKEKADDVPARLSVNEFVFTADAVRGAGQGNIDKGAEIMENVMKNLEAGGKISAETQGNTGAQEMFSVSERLGEVI